MSWNLRLAGLAVLYLLLLTGRTNAAVIVFSDQTLWQSSVQGTILTEDFEQEPSGFEVLSFPYTTADGITLDDVFDSGNVVAQMLPDGLVNGSIAPHFRAFSGDQMTFVFPVPVLAFGFHYFTSDDTWEVQVGSLVTPLPATPFGSVDFFGVVFTHPTLPVTAFTFANPGFSQGGISVDNLSSVPIPEPSTLLLLGAGMSTSLLFRLRRRSKRRDIH